MAALLDVDRAAIAACPPAAPREVDPLSLAYVSFTSGSTGEPKGVEVPHRAVVRLVEDNDFANLDPAETLLGFAPLAFDASTLEVWGPLANGGRLALAPPGPLSPRQLGETIVRHGVTTLWLTAGLFHQVVDDAPECLAGVRQLLAGGDVLSPGHVRRALDRLAPGGVLINGYGPTENTTFTCCHRLTREAEADAAVPIGRPIRGTRVEILDPRLLPVLPGVGGELCAGGDGLARGYAGRPDLTAERFVPDPWSGQAGGRLYRTGDRARHRPDGAVEFLGRLDRQAKIRGFRVEPGEVEAALLALPEVREAAVAVRGPAGDAAARRLVAWVVPAAGAAPDPEELREFLAGRLPAPMVPAAIAVLPALPRTASGKLDRAALPEPAAARTASPRRPERRAEDGAPPLAQALAVLFGEVLGGPEHGIDEDFFARGGHSLLAMRLVARVRALVGVDLPLADLFQAPTPRALSERLAERARSTRPPLLSVPRQADLPLSFAQQRLWFLDQLAPGHPFYNIPAAVRLAGRLDPAALAGALAAIERRHEALRTAFPADAGRPLQRVHPPAGLPLPWIDLSALPAERRGGAAAALAEAEAQRPFDLAAGPLVRASLLRLAPDEHIALLTLHHIVGDGWSMGVLVREIAALYPAIRDGRPANLPELPVQYADYAAWQRSWLQGEELARQLAFWLERLAGTPTILEMPLDHPRPAVETFRGSRENLLLPAPLSDGLREIGRAAAATPFMVLSAAWSALLGRWTGASDFLLGTPVANRQQVEIEGLIGFFVNELVLRVDLFGDPPVRRHLARVRDEVIAAFAHADLPFERLVGELQPERDLSRNPLFQVAVIYNEALPALALPGLQLTAAFPRSGTSKMDLSLFLREVPGGLHVSAEYNSDLFEAATMARLLGRFHAVLEAIASAPDGPLSGLPVLTAAEHRQLTAEAGGAQTFRDTSVVETIERQMRKRPGSAALMTEGVGARTVTYAELDRQSRALAAALAGLGVGAEVPVAVLAERSPEVIAAILGVLRAGGAYVPLDPSHPGARLRQVFGDCGAPLLLGSRVAAEAAGLADAPGFLDLAALTASTTGAVGARIPILPEQLAYVIYTSGSTGRPKGVRVSHAALSRSTQARLAFYPKPAPRVLLLPSLAFDSSVAILFGTLARGGTLLLPAPGDERDPARLCALVRAGRATEWLSVPALWSAVLDAAAPGDLASLKTVVVAGEAFSPRLVARHGALVPGAALCNEYGPTEGTVWATAAWLSDTDSGGGVSMGCPVAACSVFVLDRNLVLAPPGTPGELCLGGAALARDYLGQPDLTAARFVPDPLAGRPGGRLYRTGDRVRRRPDGALEFLGRLDHQVKIRGFRVEPEEIEATLSLHPQVASCAVELVPAVDPGGEARLAAYVVLTSAPAPGSDERKAAEAERVARWRAVHDSVLLPAGPEDPDADLAGWVSSATGEPIPVAEMRDWAERTVARISALGARRILEIGCGTGLMLRAFAPQAERYVGTDISSAALDWLRRRLAATPMPHVELLEREAADFAGFAPGSFDAVVLNSVVQYFPDQEYLLRVVEEAVRLLASGGALFLGDVRSLPLLPALHAWIELERGDPGSDVEQMAQIWRRRIDQEEELAIHPSFWPALRSRLSLADVAVHPKRGRARNELVRFRYDVVLTARAAPAPVPSLDLWRDWRQAGVSISALRARLAAERPDVLAFTGVPNARVAEAAVAAERLSNPHTETLGELRKAAAAEAAAAVDPEDLWSLAEELPYEVELSWARSGPDGAFDVRLARRGATAPRPPFPLPTAASEPAANDPLVASRNPLAELRRFLEERLPAALVPVHWIELPAMPLTPNGKTDRRALPRPEHGPAAGTTAPRTGLEKRIAGLFAEALGLARVARDDSFFDLGGHSLLAAQVAARLREELGTDLSLQALFEHPTPAALAAHLAAAGENPAMAAPPRHLTALQPAGALPPLLLVHPAGGTLFCYRDLARLLAPDQPVWGFQAPGIDAGTEPVADIEGLAARYLAEAALVLPDGPWHLAGWSFGGLVALEMARQRSAAGGAVGRLVLLDSLAPAAGETADEMRALGGLSRELGFSWEQIAEQRAEVSRRGLAAGLDLLAARASAEGLLPPGLEAADLRRLFAVFLAHLQARVAFRPGPWKGRAVLVRAVESESAQAGPSLGWSPLLPDLAVVEAPGGHASFLRDTNAEALAHLLRGILAGDSFGGPTHDR